MKIKESPSIILAFHGMLGRKKQTSLLLLLLTLVFSFLTAAVIYSVSSAQVLQDTRCELYGEWQYLRLSDTAADAAQVQGALPASAQVSTVIQNGIVLGADDGVAGGIGTADDTFAQLGRIVPISGDFPTQSDEIAMTTTLLDALGCSYDVGQTVTLKVAANDYDPLAGSGAVMEKAYTLCGVLPAYDVYWNLNGNLTVSSIVTEPLALDGQKFQTFYYLNAAAPVTASTDPALVANEYAYPQEDTVSSSLRFLLVAAILVSFFAVAQYFLIVLHKRVHTINTFLTLGAKNRDLRLMCLWEALFAGLAAVAAGFALGCGAAAVGLGLQKHLSFLVVPAASLVPLAVLFLLSVLLGALLPAVLVRPQITKPKEKPAKKFHLAQLPLAPQIGVGCAVLLIAVSCLYVGWRVMLPYNLDAPYACLSIKMNGTSGMPFSLKEDLAALPGVEEVSAAIDLTDTYTVTSDKIQSSQMLADIWVKDNGFYTCIIEKADLEQYGELSIGDTVTVDGQAYKLAGVYSSVRNNGKIFLPLAPQTSKGALQYSRIYFRNTQQSDLERLCTALETIGLKVRSVRNGEQDFQKLLSQCIQQSVLIFSAGAVSLLFAGLNIGLVLTGKILHNKRLIGIHMALGSSYSTELFSALVENLLCFAAAFILDLALVQLLRPTVPQTFALALTAGVYIGAFVFGAGMVLLVTWATMRNLKRRKLVELMERVS